MNLNSYQEQASQTVIYPNEFGIVYCTLGLVGESGELANKVKKVIRDSNGHLPTNQSLIHELGDVLWYVSQLARELGYDLNTVALTNLAKLETRKLRGTLHGNGDLR